MTQSRARVRLGMSVASEGAWLSRGAERVHDDEVAREIWARRTPFRAPCRDLGQQPSSKAEAKQRDRPEENRWCDVPATSEEKFLKNPDSPKRGPSIGYRIGSRIDPRLPSTRARLRTSCRRCGAVVELSRAMPARDSIVGSRRPHSGSWGRGPEQHVGDNSTPATKRHSPWPGIGAMTLARLRDARCTRTRACDRHVARKYGRALRGHASTGAQVRGPTERSSCSITE